MLIDFDFGNSDDVLRYYDYALAVLLFDSASPLHRCMTSEFDFTVLPRPANTSLSGWHLSADIDFNLFELFKLHPDTRMSRGILKCSISPKKWLLFMENCFITYLATSKTVRLQIPKGL